MFSGIIGFLDESANFKFMEILMDYCIMQQKDIEKCALTLMKAFKEEPWNENWTYEQAYTRIDEIMSARVSRGYVVYDGDIVVSMLSGRIMTYLGFKELWVDEFSVHPDYQRQGIGTKMIEYVREQLKQETEKISYIVLNTERGYPSVKFYETNGFKSGLIAYAILSLGCGDSFTSNLWWIYPLLSTEKTRIRVARGSG